MAYSSGNEQWQQFTDDNGRVYMYNGVSGKTRWLWEKFFDPNTGKDYYTNFVTGESRWADEVDRPPKPVRGSNVQASVGVDSGGVGRQRTDSRIGREEAVGGSRRQKIEFKVSTPSKTATKTPSKTAKALRALSGEEPEEIVETDPNGRRFVFNRRTKESRYIDKEENPKDESQSKPSYVQEERPGRSDSSSDQTVLRLGVVSNPVIDNFPDERLNLAFDYASAERYETEGIQRQRTDEDTSLSYGNPSAEATSHMPANVSATADLSGYDYKTISGTVQSTPRSAVKRPSTSSENSQSQKGISAKDFGLNTDVPGVFKRSNRFFCEPCQRSFKQHPHAKAHAASDTHKKNLRRWKADLNPSEPIQPNSKRARVDAAKGIDGDSSAYIDQVLRKNYPGQLKQWILGSRLRTASAAERSEVDKAMAVIVSAEVESGGLFTKDWSRLDSITASATDSGKSALNKKQLLSKKLGSGDLKNHKEEMLSSKLPKEERNKVKRSASRPYHNPYQPVLEPVTDGDPVFAAGKRIFQSMQSERLAAAFRECRSVWRTTEIFSDEMKSGTIVGTNMTLEKEFLRMNNYEADPAEVRPPEILSKALDLILEKYRSSQVDYIYMVKQFKSLRQDLLVQGIRNEISVRLYEEHARVAIQCRDVGELNQCLTQLKELYRTVPSADEEEFVAYSLLYEIYATFVSSSSNRRNLLKNLIEVYGRPTKSDHVSFALKWRSALSLNEYWKVHGLIEDARGLKNGNLLVGLTNFMMAPVRSKALLTMAKGFRPFVPVDTIVRRLGLGTRTEGVSFIEGLGAVLGEDEDGEVAMNCKESVSKIRVQKPERITAMGGS